MAFTAIHLPFAASQRLLKVRGTKSHCMFYEIFRHGYITEYDLRAILKVNKSHINKLYQKLSEHNLVMRWRDKESHIIAYTLHDHMLNQMKVQCAECRYGVKKRKNIGEFTVPFIKCTYKYAESICGNHHGKDMVNAQQVVRRTHDQIEPEIIAGKVEVTDYSYKDKEVNDWNIMDFCKFFLQKSEELYEDAVSLKIKDVRQYITKMSKIFRKSSDKRWRMFLKNYINMQFDEAKQQNRRVGWKMMANEISIGKYMELHGVKIQSMQRCTLKNVFCPYMQAGCTLEADGIVCTEKIEQSIRERYN